MYVKNNVWSASQILLLLLLREKEEEGPVSETEK